MPTESITLFKKQLADTGHRITPARLALFTTLLDTGPLGIKDILATTNTSSNRVSVYRNIDLFEKLGIVRRIALGWKHKIELSDKFIPHHHHLTCLSCGRIIDIIDEVDVENFITAVTQKHAFTPQSHHFEVSGYCKDCSHKQVVY